MVQRGRGHVVTIASSADAPGVRTTLVLPHFINTGMFAGAGPVTFFPEQKAERVARAVIDAVESDAERVVLPPTVLVAFGLRMLPPRAYDWLSDRLGLTTSMATFSGRAVVPRSQTG